MKTKPITPYQRLLDDIKDFARKVRYRDKVTMWHYPKEKLSKFWRLDDLAERVGAAEQLGYDVVLVNSDRGLEVKYVKKVPEPDFSWL